MREWSEITVSEAPPAHDGFKLVFRLVLENDKIGHHAYSFRYNYETDLLLFVELTDVRRDVVRRMSTKEGDRKSYDAFEYFTGIKSSVSGHEWTGRGDTGGHFSPATGTISLGSAPSVSRSFNHRFRVDTR